MARRAAAAVENAQLYREAQTANRMKDEFVATLSHELRTPLNALLGWTELLRSGRLPPDRQHVAVDAIERTARLQAQITNDLVDVSQAASGAFRLVRRPVAAGEVVRSAVEAFRLAADSKGVRLGVRWRPTCRRCSSIPTALQQIVFNLVANAVKFTAGRRRGRRRPRRGRLSRGDVRDTGIGIPASFLPFVFDRFRQADGSTSREYRRARPRPVDRPRRWWSCTAAGWTRTARARGVARRSRCRFRPARGGARRPRRGARRRRR